MPEIAEVARIVYYLKKSLANKTLQTVKAQDDANVFGKVGTTAAEFEKSLTGKKVLDAGQQGKYFWLVMSSPPHPVFHFGMTGWLYIRGEPSIHYRPKELDDQWPPKYWKFALETDELQKVEAAFTDARRFSRIRLVDCAAEDIRKTTPLKENGPDPVIDKGILTPEWLEKKLRSKHVPVKALLLDQANISGIGNWVGDEILYHARLHPEQYSDTFSSAQYKQLHTSMMHVCQTAVDLLADSSKFPDDWLFHHRWGKGKKDASTTLPSGEKITHITVGGRTSCVVPSVQKKTGPVTADVKEEDVDGTEDQGAVIKRVGRKKTTAKESEYFAEGQNAEMKVGKGRTAKKKTVDVGPDGDEVANKSNAGMEKGGKGCRVTRKQNIEVNGDGDEEIDDDVKLKPPSEGKTATDNSRSKKRKGPPKGPENNALEPDSRGKKKQRKISKKTDSGDEPRDLISTASRQGRRRSGRGTKGQS